MHIIHDPDRHVVETTTDENGNFSSYSIRRATDEEYKQARIERLEKEIPDLEEKLAQLKHELRCIKFGS